MTLFRFSFLILTLSCLSTAKFSQTYYGLAQEGVKACISNSNFTMQMLAKRENCGDAFRCIMENTPSDWQSIISSGAAILGFIPTVLLVLGSTNAEILRIHARYPLLAFFLSLTNINKRPDTPQQNPSHASNTLSLGPYGVVGTRRSSPLSTIVAVHVLAAAGAGVVIWQTVEIGRNGVMSWACWTDFYPLFWVGMAILQHILAAVCLRLSLRVRIVTQAPAVSPPPPPSTTSSRPPATKPQLQRQRQRQRSPSPPPKPVQRSAFLVWDLTHSDLEVEVRHKRFAKWSKDLADLVNNWTYLVGTAVFASLTLVSGRIAMQKLAAFGLIAVAARIVAVWVAEGMDGVEEKVEKGVIDVKTGRGRTERE